MLIAVVFEFRQVCSLRYSMQTKEKRQTRWEKSGKSEEELLREQEELFGLSREKYNQEGPSDTA